MNVLVTSVSRKVSLVQAFQKALKLEGGGKVIGADISPYSPGLYIADAHRIIPRSDSPNFLETLLDICAEDKVELLVPTRDEELFLFAEARELLSSRGVDVMLPDPDVIRLCQHKAEFAEFCLAHGFSVPLIYHDHSKIRVSDFPLFVRPIFGKGGRGAGVVKSSTELEQFAAGTELLVQEIVDAVEYTVDLFADFSSTVISAVARERNYVFGGESFVSKTVRSGAIISDAVRLAQELRLVGHNTMQCFYDGKVVNWIEINPRYGGAAALGFAAGCLTPRYMIKAIKGEKLEACVGDYRVGLIMLRYTQDLFMSECEFDRGAL